jgi:hypothetical protein
MSTGSADALRGALKLPGTVARGVAGRGYTKARYM